MATPTPAAMIAVRRYEHSRRLPVTARLDQRHWRRAAQYHRGLAHRYRIVGAARTGHTDHAVRWAMDRREQALIHAAACDAHADSMDADR